MVAPILGRNIPNENRCLKMVADGQCLKVGAWHIIWGGGVASITCEDHKADAIIYLHEQIHAITAACTDQYALWFPLEATCRIPISEADEDSGRVLSDP